MVLENANSQARVDDARETSALPSLQPVRERILRSAQRTSSAIGRTGESFHQLTFTAMSTACTVKFRTANSNLARQLHDEILEWVAQFEAKYSRFIPDSLISRINAAAGDHWVEVDAETDAIFNLCQEMIFFTKGVFDPTSLPLIRLWNWKANPPAIPTEETISAARGIVGWRKIQRRKGGIFLPHKGMCLDLGGIGKEYAVDRVLTLCIHRGITNVLVDFGQDVRAHGQPADKPAWHIGLDDAKNPGNCWTGVAVNNHAVATSGDYLRHFTADGRRFGHIIDPRTGWPVNNKVMAVSVIAPSCTLAGIISTSAFILGPQDGIQMMHMCPNVEGAITTESGRLQSKGFHKYATS
jgi:thiamine biosynthesis lipoprotein